MEKLVSGIFDEFTILISVCEELKQPFLFQVSLLVSKTCSSVSMLLFPLR